MGDNSRGIFMVCQYSDFRMFPDIFHELCILGISSVQADKAGIVPAFSYGCKGKLYAANTGNNCAKFTTQLFYYQLGITKEAWVAAHQYHDLFRRTPIRNPIYQDTVILLKDYFFSINI